MNKRTWVRHLEARIVSFQRCLLKRTGSGVLVVVIGRSTSVGGDRIASAKEFPTLRALKARRTRARRLLPFYRYACARTKRCRERCSLLLRRRHEPLPPSFFPRTPCRNAITSLLRVTHSSLSSPSPSLSDTPSATLEIQQPPWVC